MGLLFPITLGSTRTEQQGIVAPRDVIGNLKSRGHEPVLVDPMEKQLPFLGRMYTEYPAGEAPPILEDLAVLYQRAVGFVSPVTERFFAEFERYASALGAERVAEGTPD